MKPIYLNVSCVYAIVNLRNGKRYIGSASNFRKRITLHRFHLRRGTHDNRHLQSAWNKYGEDAFIFGVVEEIPIEQMIDREQALLDAAQPHVYNTGKVAAAPMLGRTHKAGMTGKKHSEQSKAKMRKAQDGNRHLRNLTPEQNARWYESMKPVWAKKTISSEARAKGFTAEAIAKRAASNTGKKRSELTKARLREAWVRRKARKVEAA